MLCPFVRQSRLVPARCLVVPCACDEVIYIQSGQRCSRKASSQLPFLLGSETFPQCPLQDLARAALRQLATQELDTARDFVVGEIAAAMCDQFFRFKSLSRLAHDGRRDHLAPFWVGDAEDCGLEHRGMLVNYGFDLTRVY